jgi:hypothetical protein
MKKCDFVVRRENCDYEEPEEYTENCDFEWDDSGIVCPNCGGAMYYCLDK